MRLGLITLGGMMFGAGCADVLLIADHLGDMPVADVNLVQWATLGAGFILMFTGSMMAIFADRS